MPDVRTRIVDAVDALVRSRGWSATRMADVAAEAGVSRQTVYNEFANRNALVQAYAAREIDALVEAVEAHVRVHADDAHEALSGAFALFLKLASDEPLIQVFVSDTAPEEVVRVLTGTAIVLASTRVAALIVDVWPQVSASDAALLAESLARLAISHAMSPSTDPDATAVAVTRMLGPFVDEILR